MSTTTRKKRPANKKKPPGEPTLTQTVEASACPTCHSTDRQRYDRSETVQLHPEDKPGETGPERRPWTHLRRAWTTCAKCGQRRIDRLFLFPARFPAHRQESE